MAVKERPILFSAPMVREILRDRKKQTRRIVKPQPHSKHLGYMAVEGGALLNGPDYPDGDGDFVKCPYGQAGDRLWVRETWFDNRPEGFFYRADGEFHEQFPGDYLDAKWRPSIFMPRIASRITLEITGVRVERLHEISYIDILREGMCGGGPEGRRKQFIDLWEKLNGKGSWDANLWVWCIEFRRAQPPCA